MPDIIKLLPDAIANQIAAGEVVQRPASVVKELLENAVDAGATHVKLIVKQAGSELIQVIDDGCGMSESDARLSFERHATSKINEAKDLFNIQTMGFRGEALASIAAVASVELITRKREQSLASYIRVNASKVEEQRYDQHPAGTNISVKNLFFNTPGRRKFLKSPSVELRHIREEFIHVALAHPEIALSLHSDEKSIYNLSAGKSKQRILAIFGTDWDSKLVPVEESTELVKVFGYVGKPESSKRSRKNQYLFVNKRYVSNYYINHAVKTAYEDLIEDKKHPFFVLYIQIDPSLIDINVHPTKHEIKFEDERTVYQIIHVSIKHALGKYHVHPSIDFESDNNFFNRVNREISSNSPFGKSQAQKSQSSIPSSQSDAASIRNDQNKAHWQKLYEEVGKHAMNDTHAPEPPKPSILDDDWHKERAGFRCFQLAQSYMVTTTQSGLIIIDQQAAHERVLYERLRRMQKRKELSSQRLLFPVLIELSTEEALILDEMISELNQLGFDLNTFGNNSYAIHAQPALAGLAIDPEQIILDLIKQKEDGEDLNMSLEDKVIRRFSIISATKHGRALEVEAMQNLIDELFACESPGVGLRKNSTYKKIDMIEIQKWFS